MLASFIMSLRSDGVACGAGVRQGGSSRRRGRRRRVAQLAEIAARKTTATRLYAHVRENCDELRLENDALGVRVHEIQKPSSVLLFSWHYILDAQKIKNTTKTI